MKNEKRICITIYSDGSVSYEKGVSFDVAMQLLHKAYIYEEERFREFCRNALKEDK